MKELILKISVSQCISMYYNSVIFILEFKLDTMIELVSTSWNPQGLSRPVMGLL
jgi:hypothetical protein